MYTENVRFVDPITRQTFQSADLQDCSDKHSNLFQLDVDDDKSWIELTLKLQGLQDHIYLNQKR